MIFYIVIFIILTFLGLGHYIWLVDPHYFQGDGSPAAGLNIEYQSVFNNVSTVVLNRRNHGLLFYDEESWYVTHPEIWRIISWPLTFLQNKFLNISPLNVFCSLLASLNVVLLFKKKYPGREGEKKSARKYVLYTTALFPMWLLNGNYWRDPMGIALISIGLSLVTLSSNVIWKSIFFVIFALFSYIQRTIYIIIAGCTLVGRELLGRNKRAKFILVPIFMIFLLLCVRIYDANVEEDYTGDSLKTVSASVLPLKFALGFIGPFPWTQFMLVFDGILNVAFQPADYLLGVFQFAYLMCLIVNYKRISFKNIDYSTIMGFCIMFSGLMTSVMHIGYIAEGVYFTLPWFFKQVGFEFKKYFFLSFVSLIFLNIVILLIGNMGFSSLWR